jgi:hypothetical protein
MMNTRGSMVSTYGAPRHVNLEVMLRHGALEEHARTWAGQGLLNRPYQAVRCAKGDVVCLTEGPPPQRRVVALETRLLRPPEWR